jgi:predicted PurR-regulated permease PerM
MSFFESNHQRAAALITLLGIGLLVALLPYASGLIGGLMLYVIFSPLYTWLTRRLPGRVAAGVVVGVALVIVVGTVALFASLVLDQAQTIARGVIQGPVLERLADLTIAGYPVGPRLASLGGELVTWMGRNAFGLVGTATRIGLNLLIALFIVYYLLGRPGETWAAVAPYIPFSSDSAELLRIRFHHVTVSTVIGTGLIATVQGCILALGFWLTGLSNAVFWGVVTVVLAVLPIVGSGMVFAPGALTLLLDGRAGAAITLAILGLVAGNIDVVIRPAVFRRYAQIHPLVTLVGAIGGVSYFGLLGILIGPLALSYFFELMRIYRLEYIAPARAAEVRLEGMAEPPANPTPPAGRPVSPA